MNAGADDVVCGWCSCMVAGLFSDDVDSQISLSHARGADQRNSWEHFAEGG